MVGGAETVARVCRDKGVRRLVHVSSIAALYLGPQAAPVTGATPPDPLAEKRGDYAHAKALCDRILLDRYAQEGLPVVILRPGLVLGAGTSPFHSGLGVYNNEQHCLGWNGGRNPLPFVLAEDVAAAIAESCEAEGIEGRAFNLVGDVRLDARDYTAALAAILHRPLRFHPQSPLWLWLIERAKWMVKRIGGRRAAAPSLRDLRSRGLRAHFDCSDAGDSPGLEAGRRPRDLPCPGLRLDPGRAMTSAPLLLHVFSTFAIGGPQLRFTMLANHFGRAYRHAVIAMDGNTECRARLHSGLDVTFPENPLRKGQTLKNYAAIRRLLRTLRPDLLLTYNWGAIEWAIANRLLPVARHVHLEDGFGKEEADTQIRRRVLCRRWALARCTRVVVPSRRLEDLARHVWKLPAEIITYLPNGVDVARFAAPARDTIPGFTRRPGELVVGTVAPLRPEKNVGRLLRVFATLGGSAPARLIIAGDGVERGALERLAGELGIADRVIFTGQVMPESVLGTFDIFALSSDTEQMPIALLEAMAASRAVAAVDVGDVKGMVCEENRNFIVPRDDHQAFAAAIEHLLQDDARRETLGRKNRDRVVAEFSQERMFAAYSEIFAAGRADPG